MKRTFTLLLAFAILFPFNSFSQKKKKAGTPKKEETKFYLDTVSLGGLSWRSVGPAVTSGRIADFAVHLDNFNIYYVATASGGVWKTTNAGTTYEPIFDGQGSYSIGCVTLDPNNPNTVWVGTGENNNQRSVGYGDGIYRSDDGGKSWNHMGLKNSEHIGKIIIDPRNSDHIYVAAIGPLWSAGGDRGLYESTDGGLNWEQVLKDKDGNNLLDEHTGVTDLVMHPNNPDVMYAAAFQRRRHVFTYVGGGPGSAIYKTTDAGKTWKKLSNGLPNVDLGRIALLIAPANPEITYALVEAAQGKGGFYKSTDRGASWAKQSGHTTSGNYYVEIYGHPTDANTIFSMNTFNQVSHDGGKSWSNLGEEYKHVDNHVIWIDPNNTEHYLAGCDGGIYETFDGAKTWNYKSNLPVTQFYKVEVDNALPFYHIYGGTQDNFSMGGPSRSMNGHGITNSDWYVTQLGDGFESAIDPDNPNIVYAQAQYGALTRYDKASGEMTGIQPQPREGEEAYVWNWDAPLATSKHVPKRIYFAANKLFRSDDRGDSWEVISGDLSRNIDRNTLPVMGRIQSMDAVAKNRSTSEYGNIVAFSESPLNQNLLYVGTDDGLIQITEDGGKNWTKISSVSGVPDMTYVNMLLASQHDENVVYACFNDHKRGNFKPYVYKSSDKGRTWNNISNNLPERGSAYSIAEDHVEPRLLFVGTEFSCFFTLNGGENWNKLANGLPTIGVRDIAIQKRENDLVLGTFGRGFYVLDDYSALRQMHERRLAAPADIFPIKDAVVFNEAAPLGYRTGKGFQGHNFYTADNPPMGAVFTYYMKNKVETLKEKRQKWEKEQIKKNKPIRYPTYAELKAEREEEKPYLIFTIRNKNGNIIRQLKTDIKTGVNRMVWDGHYASKSPIDLNPGKRMPWSNPDVGSPALPGDYTVSLTQVINGVANEIVAPQEFKLKSLGGVTLPAKDIVAYDAFLLEATELQRAFDGAGERLGEARKAMKHMEAAAFAIESPAPQLIAEMKLVEEKMEAISEAFYGDRTAGILDIKKPPSIAGRLGQISWEMWGTSSAPTSTHREQLRIAGKEFRPQLEELRKIVELNLPALEKKLEDAGAPYTPGRLPKWDGK